MRRVLVALMIAGLVAVSAAAAVTSRPDAHDRAIAHALAAKVAQLEKVTKASNLTDERIKKQVAACKGIGKTPADSFAVVFAMLPVLLIEVVNEVRPQLVDLRTTIDGWHPHSDLFRRWLDAEKATFDQILAFDNHGKKIDICAAAKVMLAKKPTDAQITAVLGISPTQLKALFSSSTSKTVDKLNPAMRTFLLAAGIPRAVAVKLT